MREKMVNAILPLFYIFSLVCIVGGGYYFYNKSIEQKQMILEIEKRLTMLEPGTAIPLPIKEELKNENLNYIVKDENVAVVHDEGTVVSTGEGTTTITVETEDNRSQTIVVSVGLEAIEETNDEKVVDELIKQEEQKKNEIEIESLSIDKDEIFLSQDETYNPVVTITPETATNKELIWTSSNPNLVSVDKNGKIKALQNENGTSIVTGMTKDHNNSISIKVTVTKKEIAITNINLESDYIDLRYDEIKTIKANIIPSNATDKELIWTSSNPDIVSINQEGKIIAITNQDIETEITASTKDGLIQKTARVRVIKIQTTTTATDLKIDPEIVNLNYNETKTLTATVLPENAISKKVVWTSSNPNVVTVDQEGNIKALANANQEVIITAQTIDGSLTKQAKVIVKQIPIKVTSVKLNNNNITLKSNESYQLIATVLPENATNKKVTWTSSNPNIVEVDQTGKITAKKNQKSTVTIVATTEDKISASATVNVEQTNVKVTGLTLDKTEINLKYKETATIIANVHPSNASNKEVTYSSSNASLVTVDQKGNIKAVANKEGEAIITVTTKDSSFKQNVKVKTFQTFVNVTGIKLNKTALNLKYKETETLKATISPTDASNKKIIWSSSNPSLVSVDQTGKVTVKTDQIGAIVTITAKTEDGNFISTATVTIIKENIKVTGVTLDKTSISLKKGESATLKANISPNNATDKNVTWSSSNTKLVTVDQNGKVTAIADEAGEATITVTTKDGSKKATAKVTVTKTEIKVTGVTLDKTSIGLKKGESATLKANISPSNATNKNVTWSSSNTKLVTVDQNGKVTAIADEVGEATITVTTKDGSKKATAKVTVTKTEVKVTGVTLDKSSISLKNGASTTLKATVSPSDATNKNVTWSSSNTKLITVDQNGKVTAIADTSGEATITVTTKDGSKKATAKVTVTKSTVKVTGLKLNKTDISLKYGTSNTITATVSPSNATNKKVIWTSSDTSLATVDSSGKITAKSSKVGLATITATTSDGSFKKTVKVRVYPSGNAVSFKSTYTAYKTNMNLWARNGVMQSFAIDNGYIYITQQQGTSEGPRLSKIKLSDVTNKEKLFNQQTAQLKNYGHAANIDIETTNGVKYLWINCAKDGLTPHICRVKLSNISYANPPKLQSPTTSLNITAYDAVYKNSSVFLPAVDSDNRILVIMTGSKQKHKFTVYNLDDFVKNKSKATIIYSFQTNSNDKSVSRQGFAVSGNYIYDLEGNPTPNAPNKMYISVYSLKGDLIVSRKVINYPSTASNNWESEGIKVYNNNVYIGIGRVSKSINRKYQNIYKLDK